MAKSNEELRQERERLTEEVRGYIEKGMDDRQIVHALYPNWTPKRAARVAEIRATIYSEAVLALKDRSVEQTYVDYQLKMGLVINKLQDVADDARTNGRYSAAAAALRNKGAFIDKVVERGQELGVLPRASRRGGGASTNIGVFVGMSADDLRKVASKKKEERNKLEDLYGNTPFVDLQVDDPFAVQPAPCQDEQDGGVVIDIDDQRPKRRKVR